jgi:hypothetical protein
LSVTSDAALQIDVQGQASGDDVVNVPADSTYLVRVFVSAAAQTPASTDDRTAMRFWVVDTINDDRAHDDTYFNGTGGT